MNIKIGASGKLNLTSPQQKWVDPNGDGSILQYARFAGQEMMAITDDKGAFDLHYLGFEINGFKSMELAKEAAPEFAKRVLSRMTEVISG